MFRNFLAGAVIPCVPVPAEPYPSLIYPTDDIGKGTTAELRLAVQMGATIQWVKAWVFKPTDKETKEHPLQKYVEHFTQLKEDAKKRGDRLTETIAKDVMNVLIGKLISRNPTYSEQEMLRLRQKVGDTSFREIWKDMKQRERYKSTRRTGTLWAPECWGLITGRGRAVISELIWLNGTHRTVTDSAVVDERDNVKTPEYLVSADSGFETKPEDRGDGLLSIRTRLYSLLRNSLPFGKPRRGGIPSTQRKFIEDILTPNLRAGRAVVTTAQEEHIYTIKDFLADSSHQYGTSATRTTKIRWEWDMKRRLKKWRVNPWIEYSETEPWKNVDQYILARLIRDSELPEEEKTRHLEAIPDHPDLQAACGELYPAPRSRPASERAPEVKRLREEGLTIRQIARELGVGVGTVARILRKP